MPGTAWCVYSALLAIFILERFSAPRDAAHAAHVLARRVGMRRKHHLGAACELSVPRSAVVHGIGERRAQRPRKVVAPMPVNAVIPPPHGEKVDIAGLRPRTQNNRQCMQVCARPELGGSALSVCVGQT